MNGATAMIKCLESENVSVIFGYPGAAICPFYDAITSSSINNILVRQEQNAGHSASGFARASGEVGVCVVTSGPGATNLITAIASAYMDSIAMVAISGQVRSDLIGRDVFQEADITGAVEPFVKHTYLVKDENDIPRIFKEAFHLASSGRPGPVLIDIPVDIQQNELKGEFDYTEKVDILGYNPQNQPNLLQLKRANDLLKSAKKPLIIAGGGVISAKAIKSLKKFIDKTDLPMVSTMMGVGVLPTKHHRNYGMLGTHGRACANKAMHDADVLLIIGARVGDRAVAAPGQVSDRCTIIHIDIDPAEIGKNLKAHVPIVGDAKNAINKLTEIADFECNKEWIEEVDGWRDYQNQLILKEVSPENFVDPRIFMRKLSQKVSDNSILVADVGQNQIWSVNNFEVKNGKFLTSGGMGTMGYSIPAAQGAKMAEPKKDVIAVCGDGSFQMQMMELATIVENNIGVKIVIMRNKFLGMVRELQDKFYDGNKSGVTLGSVPDFKTLASAYFIKAEEITNNEDIDKAIEKMLSTDEPYMLICDVDPNQPSL